MTPIDMPLDYCTSIVYWSLGVVATGTVESRVEEFDNTDVGLYKWRDMLDLLGFHDTKIMLAVGGYSQESAFFSRLGRDPSAMARFVTSLMEIVSKTSANGILVDWAEPEPGCDASLRAALLHRLQSTYSKVETRWITSCPKLGSLGNVAQVVYDLDSDNFKTPCRRLGGGIFAGLRHLANVTKNGKRNLTDLGPTITLPACLNTTFSRHQLVGSR
ncbi:hypothetical protein MRX96_040154 [Rhipicephalus microplus]